MIQRSASGNEQDLHIEDFIRLTRRASVKSIYEQPEVVINPSEGLDFLFEIVKIVTSSLLEK
jgi:hypothetical protein